MRSMLLKFFYLIPILKDKTLFLYIPYSFIYDYCIHLVNKLHLLSLKLFDVERFGVFIVLTYFVKSLLFYNFPSFKKRQVSLVQ